MWPTKFADPSCMSGHIQLNTETNPSFARGIIHMPFPQWWVSGVPGLWRVRHLSSSLNKILHRVLSTEKEQIQKTKSCESPYPRTLHVCLLPTQAIGVQTVATSPLLASYTQFLWLTLFLFTEKHLFCQVQKNSFANPHKQRGLPNKLLHRVIFLKCFSSSSIEGENLSLHNVLCVPCNSLGASMSRQGFLDSAVHTTKHSWLSRCALHPETFGI